MSPEESNVDEQANYAFCRGMTGPLVPACMIVPVVNTSGEFASTAISLECFTDKWANPKNHTDMPKCMQAHTWALFKQRYKTASKTVKGQVTIPDHEAFYPAFYRKTFNADGTLLPPQPHAPEKRFQPNKHRIRTNCCAKWHQL